jgi:GNAT superfamily N-acetyltransferase
VQPLDEQIGFARLITDYTIFAYLCDVYILDAHRGHGLGTWLIESVLGHPELQTVRRWTLVTNDAHEFYAPQGFTALRDPSKHMERIHAAVADAAARDNTT